MSADFLVQIVAHLTSPCYLQEPVHGGLLGFGVGKNEGYAFEHLLESEDFLLQVLPAFLGDPVGSHAPIRGRDFPRCLIQTSLEKPLQSWIERPLFNLQEVSRSLLNVLDHCIAIDRLTLQRLENNHLERAGKKITFASIAGKHRQIRSRPSVNKCRVAVKTSPIRSVDFCLHTKALIYPFWSSNLEFRMDRPIQKLTKFQPA